MTRKTSFFEGCSSFKFSNFGLALVMGLEFYTIVAKELKLKVRKFWELIFTFVEVIGEKLVREPFCPYILNRILQKLCKLHFFKTLLYIFLHYVSNWAHFVQDVSSHSSILHSNFSLLCKSVLGPDFLSLSSRYEKLLTKLYLSTIWRWFY